MSREWGATGAGDFCQVEIGETAREHITLQLRAAAADLTGLHQFFRALGEAISLFHSHRNLAERSKPSVVRDNIEDALKAALTLNDFLNSLDGNSRLLLQGQVEGSLSTLQAHHLQAIVSALCQAKKAAAEYPRGRLKDHARLWLAVDVADALKAHLRSTPSSTKDGQFEAILAIVLEDATGKKSESTHHLARRAIAMRKLRDHSIITREDQHKDD